MADQRLSEGTIRQLAAQYSDWDPESVVRIAWRESNFVPTAFADDSDDLSYGLLQLNMKPGTADIDQLRKMFGITRNEELFNPVVNIRAAHVLYQSAGNSFRPWNIVPPIKNYPTSGGSTIIPPGDGQGGDVGLTDAEMKTMTDWIAANAAFAIPFNQMSVKLQKENVQKLLDAAEDGDLSIPANIVALMEKFIATEHEPGVGEVISDIPGNVASNVGENLISGIPGLGTLLATITSLSFWKKVGVGAIALILILTAFALYNKDKVVPMITKGAVNG